MMLNTYFSSNRFIDAVATWESCNADEIITYTLVFGFALFFMLEMLAPRKKWPAKLWYQSWRTNIALFLFNNFAISLLMVSSLLLLADQYSTGGLLSYVSSPIVKLAISLIWLDLLMYLWHKASHEFDSLWMFHKVHHSDPTLNVSTAFRLHIVELICITILKAVSVLIIGIDKETLLITEGISTFFAIFSHMNISFHGEKYLGKLVITPYLHRMHHSLERSEHDHNYGGILSIWDRLMGTLLDRGEPAEIGIRNSGSLDFIGQLKFGFLTRIAPTTLPIAYKPQSSVVDVNLAIPNNMQAMIAEAAYYRAQKRDFSPGNEFEDWLEAEHEMYRQIYSCSRKVEQVAVPPNRKLEILNTCLT